MVADAALGRPEGDVVLNPEPGEDLDLAVVHLDRARDDDLALGMGEDLPDAWFEVENARRPVELLEQVVEERAVNAHAAGQPSTKRTVRYNASCMKAVA